MKTALWAFLLFFIAAITSGAQLDRQSRVTPELASVVPAPFRSFSQETISANAIRSGDEQTASLEARKLIARRPLPAEHLRALAVADGLEGNEANSVAAIQEAGRRGWRDPAVQQTMLRLALANDDTGEAVRRYAALIANPRTPDALLRELGKPALASTQARADFATILTPARNWHRLFLTRSVRTLPPEIADEVISRAGRLGADFSCPDLRQAQRILGQRMLSGSSYPAQAIAQRC